jgi:hypothetical protein
MGNGGGAVYSLSCWHFIYMLRDKTWRKPDRVIASLKYGKRHTREILLTSFIICPLPDLWLAGSQARNKDRRQSLTNLTMWPRAPTSIKYRLQSYPWLFSSSLRSAYLAVLRSLALLASLSQGQNQLDQGYHKPTIHWPINNDKIRSLCLHHHVSRDRLTTRGLQPIQVTVQLNRTLVHKSRL